MPASSSSPVPEAWRVNEGLVPKARYIDPQFLRLEHEKLFPSTWQMACREEELKDPGDFVEYRIGTESILVMLGANRELKAYFNACPHRGTRLAGGRGQLEEFRCPFHSWRFGLDGRCTYVHDEPDFGEDFDRNKIRLGECLVDTWGGWVFVHMDVHAAPLADWLGPVAEALAPFDLQRMRYRWHKSTPMNANWKTVIDAFIESYHVGGLHPQMVREVRIDHGPATVDELAGAPYSPSRGVGFHSHSNFGARPIPADFEAPRTIDPNDRKRVLILAEYSAHMLGALATERDVRAARRLQGAEIPDGVTAFEMYQRLRREEAEADGIEWPQLSNEQLIAGQGIWHVFPSMVVLVEPGCALGYRVLPHRSDPEWCSFEAWTLELYPDGASPAFEPLQFADWRDHDGWGMLLPQDFSNLPNVTAGMASRGFRGLRLNPVQEAGLLNAHRSADRILFGTE